MLTYRASSPSLVPGDQMPRKRMQRGNLYIDGAWWRVRWYEDIRDSNGVLKKVRRSSVVGPSEGPGKLAKKEARKRADELLSPVNAKAYVPASMMTVEQFVVQHWEPEVVFCKKHSGKLHYQYLLSHHIIPALGKVALRDVDVLMVQKLCHGVIRGGLSVKTANHVRSCMSAIIEHAKRLRVYVGENPASLVMLPEYEPKKKPSLNFEQAQKVLLALQEPYRTIALLAMSTSLRIGEIVALRWGRVNLSGQPLVVDDMVLPPFSFAVVEAYYRGKFGSVKTKSSNRIQPLPLAVVEQLRSLQRTSEWTDPEHLVFTSRKGTPIDAHNVAKRHLKPAGKIAGVPSLSWHSFRRTTATLTGLLNMPKADRVALMGHSDGSMTDYYSDSDITRRRQYVDELAQRMMWPDSNGRSN